MDAEVVSSPRDAIKEGSISISPRTQARTDIKIHSPTLWSREQLQRTPPPGLAHGRPVRSAQIQEPNAPAEQDQGGGADSFDNFEEVPSAAVVSTFWKVLWASASVTFIVLLIPLGTLLLSSVTGRTKAPCPGGGHCVASAGTVHPPSPQGSASTTDHSLTTTKGPFKSWLEADFVEDVPRPTNCDLKVQDDSRTRPSGPMSTSQSFDNRLELQYRHVFCHLDTQYWRSVVPYPPSLLPDKYCTALVLSGFAVDADKSDIVWRPASGEHYLDHFRNLRKSYQLKHNMKNMSFFTTIGGRPEDSRNFSFVVQNSLSRQRFVANIQRSRTINTAPEEGVHIDWNYPGDACSNAASVPGFAELLRTFRLRNISVMISIPPVESRMEYYSLSETAAIVEYVIIKTHTLALPGYVSCSGVRPVAARVFSRMRNRINRNVWLKIGYSISVGGETFISDKRGLGAAASSEQSRWDNYTLQPRKTHYAAICHNRINYENDSLECGYVLRIFSNTIYLVATLHSRASMLNRIKYSYDDGMGIAPVMAYDIDLDDFEGRCGQLKSPLVRSIATGYF